MIRESPRSRLFPYTTLFRSKVGGAVNSPGSVLWKRGAGLDYYLEGAGGFSNRASKGKVSVKYANGEVRTRKRALFFTLDRKSTRLNSSHLGISYAVFCLKKK